MSGVARRVAHGAVGLLLNVVVFAAVGPAFGAFAVCVGMMVLALAGPRASMSALPAAVATLPLMLIVAFPIAYVIGTGAAAVTGALVGAATSLIRRPFWIYVFAACAGATSAALVRSVGPSPQGLDSVTLAVPGALAALFCTRLARPFRLASGTPPPAAGQQS